MRLTCDKRIRNQKRKGEKKKRRDETNSEINEEKKKNQRERNDAAVESRRSRLPFVVFFVFVLHRNGDIFVM